MVSRTRKASEAQPVDGWRKVAMPRKTRAPLLQGTYSGRWARRAWRERSSEQGTSDDRSTQGCTHPNIGTGRESCPSERRFRYIKFAVEAQELYRLTGKNIHVTE